MPAAGIQCPDISVILCTHNPRVDFLRRTLDALADQRVHQISWELLLVDNCSDEPLEGRVDVAKIPSARIVREEALGLTPARLCGIRESLGSLIVFADDDNVFDSNYLQTAFSISRSHPCVGAFGGQCIPEFTDGPPADWAKPYLQILAIREFEQDQWTSKPDMFNAPYGAGMVVHRHVAQAYVAALETSPIRRCMDRKGQSLFGAGDTDLALTACDIGMGIGLFHGMKLKHLIPRERLEEKYLLRMWEACHCSMRVAQSLRGRLQPLPRRNFIQRVRRKLRYLLGRGNERNFLFGIGAENGLAKADEFLKNNHSLPPEL
jgi:glycosyltransferase involved in cell wall biosynthesis